MDNRILSRPILLIGKIITTPCEHWPLLHFHFHRDIIIGVEERNVTISLEENQFKLSFYFRHMGRTHMLGWLGGGVFRLRQLKFTFNFRNMGGTHM